MTLDKSLIEKFRNVTSKAAYAASKFKGLNDKKGTDKAAVDVMRSELNKIEMDGKVVIGEGELDEAPMLYIGEEVGKKNHRKKKQLWSGQKAHLFFGKKKRSENQPKK